MSASHTTAVVVGNPKPESRTLAAARHVATRLTGAEPDLSVDLARLGTSLLDGEDARVAHLVEQVRAADLVIVGSPTYKASFTGLLKVFLDRFPHQGLRGTVAVPLMLGGAAHHTFAAELGLRPVLLELGATLPVPGLYLLDFAYDDPAAYDAWAAAAQPVVSAVLAGSHLATGVHR